MFKKIKLSRYLFKEKSDATREAKRIHEKAEFVKTSRHEWIFRRPTTPNGPATLADKLAGN